MIKKIVFTD